MSENTCLVYTRLTDRVDSLILAFRLLLPLLEGLFPIPKIRCEGGYLSKALALPWLIGCRNSVLFSGLF